MPIFRGGVLPLCLVQYNLMGRGRITLSGQLEKAWLLGVQRLCIPLGAVFLVRGYVYISNPKRKNGEKDQNAPRVTRT